MSSVRWVHLSDFHMGKDETAQKQQCRHILTDIKKKVDKGQSPDFVFITGDLANKGKTQEYDAFNEDFLLPLGEILGDENLRKVYIVPGNHDVDQAKASMASRYGILEENPRFLDADANGMNYRNEILFRFKAFIENDFTDRSNWLESQMGCFTTIENIGAYTLGILCINTAWFSRSNKDYLELSPGKMLVEKGLENIQPCDIKIVLGHHPIDWFHPTEVGQIRSLFGKHNVIYLHGHLHKSQARFEYGAGYPFLPIQAGASFQARDDEIWVNGFLWGELNFENRDLKLQPLQWHGEHHEWKINFLAFPDKYRIDGGDKWVFKLPEDKPLSPAPNKMELPNGWVYIDQRLLERHKTEEIDLVNYFDGRKPNWSEALSPKIPRRAMVADLKTTLEQFRRANDIAVTILMGAGGEGKSTVLRQVVCDLVLHHSDWQVIWHEDTDQPLSSQHIRALPGSNETWLIVSDDGALIAKDVFKTVQNLKQIGRRNFQFLLCSRDTDWLGERANLLSWNQYVNYSEKKLRGLLANDAREIIKAWYDYGGKGLGELANPDFDLNKASQQLMDAARSELHPQEGTFLGAMLRVRKGKGLEPHIAELLGRLHKIPAPGGTLMDALGYIAALHSENIYILSKIVLAEALGCKPGDIKRRVLGPLGEEAGEAIATSGQFVFTRHQAIADIIVKTLIETFHFDFEEIYSQLVRSARQVYLDNPTKPNIVPQIEQWTGLSPYFLNKGKKDIAFGLAQTLVDIEPTNPVFIVKLAHLHRTAGTPAEEIAKVFRYSKIRGDRAYYNEWAILEEEVGNFALSGWLTRVTLADGVERTLPNSRLAFSLELLKEVFAKLYEQNADPIFREASKSVDFLAKFWATAPHSIQTKALPSSEVASITSAFAKMESALTVTLKYLEIDLPYLESLTKDLKLDDLKRLINSRIGS